MRACVQADTCVPRPMTVEEGALKLGHITAGRAVCIDLPCVTRGVCDCMHVCVRPELSMFGCRLWLNWLPRMQTLFMRAVLSALICTVTSSPRPGFNAGGGPKSF